jgi:phospholipid transport system substrate-binding protein
MAWLRAISWIPVCAILTFGAAVPRADDGPEPASQVVENLHAALLDTMKRAEELGYDGRRSALTPVVRESFDFPFMARLALGRGWRSLEEGDQSRWVGAFEDLSLSTYAARFDGWSGQAFEMIEVTDADHGTRLVKTRLVIPDDDPVQLHYRLRENADGWRIIDIYLDGTVSEVALRRSEFSSVFERQGFDALLSRLQAKIESYAAGAVASPST